MQQLHSILFIPIVFFIYLSTSSAQSALSGTVTDASTGETLIGVILSIPEVKSGTTTNEYGHFSLQSPKDSFTLVIQFVGYQQQMIRFPGASSRQLNIRLQPGIELEEVVIKEDPFREQLNQATIGVTTLQVRDVKALPVLFGETDILKTIQMKPGVTSGTEGNTNFYVRGGGADQNLLLLDEAIVYNANHLFGFFSTFNSDAIKNVELYKGGFPAQYGSRLSSVINVVLNDGNKNKFSGTGGIGLIASRLTLEGPIQKEKSSWILSSRRTYVDIFTRAINKANEGKNSDPIPDYYFYDLNSKVNFILGPSDKLYLSGYFGKDKFDFQNKDFSFNFYWGNSTGTLRWNHEFNRSLFSNMTFTYSDYVYEISNKITGFNFSLGSEIRDINWKTDFDWVPANNHQINFGTGLTHHTFYVSRLRAGSDDGKVSFTSGEVLKALEWNAYAQDKWAISEKCNVNAGIRWSGFSQGNKTHMNLEPRIIGNYKLNPTLSLKASYTYMSQFIHLIGNSGISLPTDVWYPSNQYVKPQNSHQFSSGLTYLLNEDFLLTNEYYYKTLSNQLEFKNFANLFVNDNLANEFTYGKGYAYGTEIYLEKRGKPLTGWIGYHLAYTRRGAFNDIQGGKYFAPRHDRRHDISIVAVYELSKRVTLSATWVYGSGDLTWLPIGRYTFQDIDGGSPLPVVPVYGDRNNIRLAPYHRGDIALVWKFFPKWGKSDLTFSVYNVYDRRNPFFVYIDAETKSVPGVDLDVVTSIKAKQVSLFPVLPAITWNFSF